MRLVLFSLLFFNAFAVFSQPAASGLLTGNLLDEGKKAVSGATVQLVLIADSAESKSGFSDETGAFSFQQVAFGYYRLKISSVGFQPLVIDSIHFRAERFDFNLSDIVLKLKKSNNLDEVVVYAEKPLVESKDGNITFNAGESALSAGSNANDLLTNVPLVTKDPTGKLLVRGKEPKILIDDKPVELNQQQLQDLLESLPGSSIEKIEVMTNPPAQYANEQGGVINITTKKGKVGKSGRVNLSFGTRGEASLNGNFNYRKQGLAFNINGGGAYNEFRSNGYTYRVNNNNSKVRNENAADNKNFRPNFRANIDYDLNKFNALNLVLQYNQNRYNNRNDAGFRTVNIYDSITALRDRIISNDGENYNPNTSLTYTAKTKLPGEVFRFIGSVNFSKSDAIRNFYEQFLNPDFSFSGKDSAQVLNNTTDSKGYNFRVSYDRPLKNKKTTFSTGGFYHINKSHIVADAVYQRAADNQWVALTALNNEFVYRQNVANLRGSAKHILGEQFSAVAGLSAEHTQLSFDLYRSQTQPRNDYWSFLPFGNINKNWKEVLNATFSYRRTIRRPGANELNPTVDSSDANNLRVGNLELKPSMAHNFDLVLGKTKRTFYVNLGLGYNQVSDIFNLITTAIDDKTNLRSWENSSGKKEYEISTWSGYTLNKKTKVNLSASYTYNEYDLFEKTVKKFRNGGSLTSNINANYTWKDLYSVTSSFTYNRFANPQGTVRSNLSMNMGFQAKLLNKKMTFTVNFIDPFTEQENRSLTYGTSFVQENFNATATRNIRFTLGYNFTQNQKKNSKKAGENREKLKNLTQPTDANQ